MRFAGEPPVAEFKKLAGVSDVTVEDHLLRLRVLGPITPVVQAAARLSVTDFLSREPSLEETFLAQYGREAATDAPAEVK
jgi:ABC-2 type transport system ATP-binding protein